jgi:hypothetical protein
VDRFEAFKKSIEGLTKKQVYVGVPQENNARDDVPFGNAAIGYLNENGSPAKNIPARPHLSVGVLNASSRVANIFRTGARAAMDGDVSAAENALIAAGQVAADSVRSLITSGLNPPLSDSTVAARARRGRKGAKAEMAARALGKTPSSETTKPLLDTGEYKNSITYVLREA